MGLYSRRSLKRFKRETQKLQWVALDEERIVSINSSTRETLHLFKPHLDEQFFLDKEKLLV